MHKAVISYLKENGRKVDKASLRFDYLPDGTAPGVEIFRVFYRDVRGSSPGVKGGVVGSDGKPEFDRYRALGRVVAAWQERGAMAEPAVAAQVVAYLFGSRVPTDPILSQSDIEPLKDAWKPHLHLPRATESAGRPGVVFWQFSGPDVERVEVVFGSGEDSQWRIASIRDVMRNP